ncbi:HlyC/CorC family transporter [Thioalkalivibrio paradoxus]|uniref:Magnesium and cobalt efflux protein CorC n=1 Tax=Thioalkalivibrio paradoxus ARh 1 TaxID=713585 RepID=W0DJE2_9GAMM|nr:HlyC/CorC family transporter [Thioalkalivibrio paradoxus]AHE97357.1 membrane protein [Thioalkalivibrio paradoxus ARh 1]
MYDIPLTALFGALFLLFLLSAFFSGSETALMALNRYRMRHKAQLGHRGASLAARLLERPDRLIGLILLGNNFVNILITQIATFIGWRLFGDTGVAIATGLLTLALLIFAETAPKTVAALHSERIAYPAAWVYSALIRPLAPVVFVINFLANGFLRVFGIRMDARQRAALSADELRSVVVEAGSLIPAKHQRMLINLLDLERTTVEDIMIPRNEIVALDLEEDWNDVLDQILSGSFTRVPVIEGELDRVLGFVHMRDVLPLAYRESFGAEELRAVITPPYFIPEGTALNRQLINFQKEKRRIGLVVDEYGDIEGLVTLEDLLEEIVGEFTTDSPTMSDDVLRQPDGSVVVDGGIHLRELNRALDLNLPVDGPKTLSGLIVEHLEEIPEAPASVRIAGVVMDIVQIKNNTVRTVRIPPAAPPSPPEAS